MSFQHNIKHSRSAIWVGLLLIAAMQPALDASAGTSATVTVGSDGNCDYSDLLDVTFNGPDVDTLYIQVAKNISVTGVQVLPASRVAVFGGYDSCSDSTASGRTTLDGSAISGNVPVLLIAPSSSTPKYSVELHDIKIINGTALSGAAIRMSGPVDLYLINSEVRANTATSDGGGIEINGSSGVGSDFSPTRLILLDNSIITQNDANRDGGGIWCEGNAAVFSEFTQISFNTADERGGGIFSDGCYVALAEHGGLQGVLFNETTATDGKGGGIYAQNGALLVDGRVGPSAVISNSADYGGGIYVYQNTLQVLGEASINGNTAEQSGGGIFASASNTQIGRVLDASECDYACTEISENNAEGGSGTGGGGIFVYDGTIEVYGAFISENYSGSGVGAAIHARMPPPIPFAAQVQVYGSVIADNYKLAGVTGPGTSVVELIDANARFGFVTFANNKDNFGSGTFNITVHNPPDQTTSGGSVWVYGSIFYQSGLLDAHMGLVGTLPSGECNRLSESVSALAQNSPKSTSASPSFVDPANGDYRLARYSFMLDWCDSSANDFGIAFTADGSVRPWDDPDVNQVFGNYDLGAMERNAPLDVIFANGFEF